MKAFPKFVFFSQHDYFWWNRVNHSFAICGLWALGLFKTPLQKEKNCTQNHHLAFGCMLEIAATGYPCCEFLDCQREFSHLFRFWFEMKIWACILSNSRFTVIQLLEIFGNVFDSKATPTLIFFDARSRCKTFSQQARNTAMLLDSIWGQGESPSKTHGRCILKISNAPKQLFCLHLARGKCILHCMVAFHQESSSLANSMNLSRSSTIWWPGVSNAHLPKAALNGLGTIQSSYTVTCSIHGAHSGLLQNWTYACQHHDGRPEASTSTTWRSPVADPCASYLHMRFPLLCSSVLLLHQKNSRNIFWNNATPLHSKKLWT